MSFNIAVNWQTVKSLSDTSSSIKVNGSLGDIFLSSYEFLFQDFLSNP